MLIVVAMLLAAGLLSAGGAALFTGSPSTKVSASAPVDPAAKAALNQALTTALAKGSFNYVSSSKSSSGSATTVGTAGRDSGIQHITTTDPTGTTTFRVIVSGKAAYFRGGEVAIEENLGLNATVATTYSNHWISLAQTDGTTYSSVYAAVVTHDALYQSISMKAQQMGTATLRGQTVDFVKGAVVPVTIPGEATQNQAGTATLDISQSTHLPLRYVERTGSGKRVSTLVMTFSSFGLTVAEEAPGGAVPFSSISGSSGSSPSPSFLT